MVVDFFSLSVSLRYFMGCVIIFTLIVVFLIFFYFTVLFIIILLVYFTEKKKEKRQSRILVFGEFMRGRGKCRETDVGKRHVLCGDEEVKKSCK